MTDQAPTTTGPGPKPDEVDYFVVRSDGAWTLTPIPPTDPEIIEVGAVLARLRSGAGTFTPRSGPAAGRRETPLAPGDAIAPVWMFVGLAAAGHFVVGDPTGGQVLLDELDVALLDALRDETTVEGTDPDGAIAPIEVRCERYGRLVAAGCARLVRAAPSPAPADEHPQEVAAAPDAPPAEQHQTAPGGRASLLVRAKDAYRLSSKLRPLREAIESRRGGSH